jgi:hypothetical protein
MTAKCCCGACAIEVTGAPVVNALCHCANCKRRTGSAIGWSVYVNDSQVAGKTGDVRCYSIGDRQQRWFCATCGTTLFWKVAVQPGRTGIAGGCFGDDLPAPEATVSNNGRCAWIGLPPEWRTAL